MNRHGNFICPCRPPPPMAFNHALPPTSGLPPPPVGDSPGILSVTHGKRTGSGMKLWFHEQVYGDISLRRYTLPSENPALLSTSHFVYRPSGPLQHVPAPLSGTSCRSKYFPTRRHIFRHRSTALRTSLRRSEFFPTLLLGASHCSNICPIGSVVLLAALIFSHIALRLQISRRSLRS